MTHPYPQPPVSPAPAASIWRNDAFRKLWSGRTISMFGSQITTIALPLLAGVTLGASPGQMAGLWGMQFLPNLLIGLFAGAWIDRLPRRPVLIAADIGRAVLLLLLPLATSAGVLRIELLYTVAVLAGVCTVFADAADNAYLPALVRSEQLIEANARLATSGSVAGIVGPGLAGLLIDLLRAPGAIAVDAVSFLVSAAVLGSIRAREPAREAPTERRNIWAEIGLGVRVVYGNRILRIFLATTVSFDLFFNALIAVYFLYVTRELGLPATAIGILSGVGSVGALLGTVLAERLNRRVGVGPTIIGAQVVLGSAVALFALPVWLPDLAIVTLAAAEFGKSLAAVVAGISRAGVMQAIVPNRLLGRVWASQSFIGLGIVPVGALLGGVLGERLGVPATIVIGAFGGFPAFLWLAFSPVRNIRTMNDEG